MALKSIKEWKICKCPNCEKKYKKEYFILAEQDFHLIDVVIVFLKKDNYYLMNQNMTNSIPEDLLTK